MGYSTDWMERSCFGRTMLTIMTLMYLYLSCMLLLFVVKSIISFVWGETFIVEYISHNLELLSFCLLLFGGLSFYLCVSIIDRSNKTKLTEDERNSLSEYHFGKMSRAKKKIMARAIKLAPSLIFLKLSRMDLHYAIKMFIYKDSRIHDFDCENKNIFLKSIYDMVYVNKGISHTLKEWDIILTEERIKWYKERINFERNRFHKRVKRSGDAKQADLLNISYLNYRRYNSYYNGIKKVISQFGLNSKEVKESIALTLDKIDDLQEWKDFVESKEKLILHEPTEKGRYATYNSNIISNTSNVCNIFFTEGSFYIMAYFDNITYEERDTFIHDKIVVYVYKYEFVPYVIMEFARLRFAFPINLKDNEQGFDKWILSNENTIKVHLIERNTGRFVATRNVTLKKMAKIKELVNIQKHFNKELMDISIRKCTNKSLDEMVFNGFILEEIKGDNNMIEPSLF